MLKNSRLEERNRVVKIETLSSDDKPNRSRSGKLENYVSYCPIMSKYVDELFNTPC